MSLLSSTTYLPVVLGHASQFPPVKRRLIGSDTIEIWGKVLVTHSAVPSVDALSARMISRFGYLVAATEGRHCFRSGRAFHDTMMIDTRALVIEVPFVVGLCSLN